MAKKDEQKRSAFKSAVITSPILAGLGVGIHRLYKNGPKSFRMPGNIFGSSTPKFIDEFASNLKGPVTVNYPKVVSSLKGQDFNPEVVGMAWHNAVNSSHGDFAQIDFDPAEPFKAAEFFSNRNTNIHAGKVMDRFLNHLHELNDYDKAFGLSSSMFGTIEPYKAVGKEIDFVADPLLNETLTNIHKQISQTGASMRVMQYDRGEASQLMVEFTHGPFGGGKTHLELPMEIAGSPGVISHGIAGQTRMIVGKYGIVDPATNMVKEMLNHQQYAARKFAETVLPKLMQRGVPNHQANKLVRSFNRDMLEGAQWIPNLPAHTLPAIDLARKLGGDRLRLVKDPSISTDPLTSKEMAAVKRAHDATPGSLKLYPGTSPNQLAHGVWSTVNPQDYWLGGTEFPVERRPGQAFGRFATPTAEAAAARWADPIRSEFSWLYTKAYREQFNHVPLDMLARVTYVNESQHVALAEQALGGAPGGSGLVSGNLSGQMEYETYLQENLDLKHPVSKRTLERLGPEGADGMFHQSIPFEPGEIIGHDSTGAPVYYEQGMNFTGGMKYSDRDQNFLRLHGTRLIKGEQAAKYYGGLKGQLHVVDQDYMSRLVREHTRVTGLEANNIVLGMDELRKNRSLHNTQILTSLQDFLTVHMNQSGSSFGASASYQNIVKDLIPQVSSDSNAVIKGAYSLAKQYNLPARDIGRIFGTLPAVLKDYKSELGLDFTKDEMTEIDKGVAHGIAPFIYGGKKTSGGRSSIEPRFFEILKGGQYGALGPAMAGDIASRMIQANPEMVYEQSILGSALRSIRHGVKDMDGVAVHNISDLSTPASINEVLSKGGIVNLEGSVDGTKRIHIPGAEESLSMRPYANVNGQDMYGELRGAYSDFLNQASAVARQEHGATRRSAAGAMDTLVGELGAAYAGTIGGDGYGLARGKVMGSRYLNLVSATEKEMGNLHTVGISKAKGNQMFQDLMHLHKNDAEEMARLTARRKSFLSGEAVGGILARHPNIGPYSIRPTQIKMVEGLSDTDILIPQKTARVMHGGKEHLVALGSMGGLAADTDGDNADVMLSSSTIEKDIMGHYTAGNHELLARDREYTIRQQLMKARAPEAKTILSETEKQIAGFTKSVTAKTEVGPLSVPLRQMKAAVVSAFDAGKMNHNQFYDSWSLLEGLEQTPISSKHIPADEYNQIYTDLSSLKEAATKNKAGLMESVTRRIFKHNKLASEILEHGAKVSIDGGAEETLRGINVGDTSHVVANAVTDFRQASGGMSDARMQNITAGRGKLRPEEIDSLLSKGAGALDFVKLSAKKGLGSAISKARSTVMNQVMQAGGEILSHVGKPLALGFGASLALSAVLSKPESNLSPDASAAPMSAGRVNTSNKKEIAPDTMFPDSGVTGAPTISSPLTGPSQRISPNRSFNINIRGSGRSNSNYGSMVNGIKRQLGGGTDAQVRINDRRSTLSPHKIDDILRR